MTERELKPPPTNFHEDTNKGILIYNVRFNTAAIPYNFLTIYGIFKSYNHDPSIQTTPRQNFIYMAHYNYHIEVIFVFVCYR